MAQSFAKEINWWKSRAAEFDTKRARLQPLSYSYASQAYATRGNLNGAASLDSMRLDIYKKADAETRAYTQGIMEGTVVTPTKTSKSKNGSTAAKPLPATVVKPSESVANLDDQVAKLQRKIKGIGGDVTRTLVGGFSRAMDLISRFDYAAQNIRADAITDAKASGGNISIGEHLQIAAKPFLFMTPASGFIATAAIMGNDSAKDMYSDGWAGLSGKKKVTGIDNMRAEYPNWATEHNVAANVLGFASDIVSDPTTYLTMGSGTAVKTGGSVGARLIGQKALARSLAEETIWTKAGRAAGTQTLKDNMRAAKTVKAAKASKAANKTYAKAATKFEKGSTKFNRGKITEEGLDTLKARLGTAEGHRALAAAEYSRVHEAAFADELRGFGDVAQYLVKHPFKATGSYGQGLRAGSVAEGNKAAKAIHDGVKSDFITEITKVDDAATPAQSMQLHTRLFHELNKGKTLQMGAKSFKVSEDYTQFAKDVADNLFKYTPVTELTSRAARGRYSVLAAAKKDRNEFVNMLVTKGDANFVNLTKYADNVLAAASPIGRKATAVKAAAAPTTAPEEVLVNPSIRRAADETLAADVERAVNGILQSKTLRESMMMDLFDARPPELAIMDEANGISPDHVAAREYFKTIARQKMTEAGIPLDEAGRVAVTEERAVGDFAATGGVHQVGYTAKRDRAIAQALSDTMEQAVRDIALHNIMNDPDIIVKGYMDAAHEMINKVSADTHVQVMEYMRYKHGLAMPSMNMPRNHVDELYTSGDIWDGLPSPQFAEKHYAGYLRKQIDDAIGPEGREPDNNFYWQMWDVLDPEAHIDGFNGSTPNKNAVNGTMDDTAEPGLLHRLTNAALELKALHYGPGLTKNGAAVDKYTMLDHFVFGRGPTEELKIGVGGTDPKIGRVAFASDSVNTNGIPAYNPKLLADIAEFNQLEKDVIAGYAKYDKIGYPQGIQPRTAQEVKDYFNGMRHRYSAPDLRYISDGADGINPQAMLHSLGSHLDLLHNTTEYGNFSVKWRRQMASNLWGIPAEKGTAKNGTKFFAEGKWTSASLMADLNDAISLGILEKTLKHKMTPEAVADWLANTTRDNPILEMIMKDANIQAVREGSIGAGFIPSNAVTVTATPEAKLLAEQRGINLNPFEQLDAEEARMAAAHEAAMNPLDPTTPESIAPGGFAAPNMNPENIKFIQQFIDKTYGDVDVVTLSQLMEDMRGAQLSNILFYDQKMQEALGGMQLQNSMQVRVMGMPIVSLPVANNPMHTNAGVLAMNQDLPKHLHARSKIDLDGNAAKIQSHRWLTRPTSKLDEGMRRISTKFSGESTFDLKQIMDNVKVTYRSFKNKAELHVATKDFFTLGTTIDPRLVETERRFNDIHNFIMDHAGEFTGKDLGYDSNFVKGSVNSLMAGLPNEFRIDQSAMKGFDSVEPIFSREWFVSLSNHLAKQKATTTHPLSALELKKLDMAKFEFGFQHTAAKLKVRNNTSRTMFETFSAPMRSDVVRLHNAQEGIEGTRNAFVPIEDFFGGGIVPEDLKGRYVSEHVAEEMKKVINFIDESMDNRRQKINFGYMRDINNMWKGGVTVFSARYHVGNVMSDGFMNLIDGVRPASYKKAINTIVTDPDVSAIYSDPVFMEAMNATFAKADIMPDDIPVMQSTIDYVRSHGHSRPISMVTIEGKPMTVTSAEYQLRYRGYGLDQNNVTGNLSKGTENMQAPGISQVSNISDIVQNASATREDYFRMAHFIHAFEQEARVPGRTADDAWLAARDRVVQWHFDYDNVTEFERNFIAPVAPFYKWTRNIVPLSFSVFFTNPKAYTIGNAANRSMGQIMFPTQEDDDGNEVPLDLVIPRWIPEQGAVPMEVYTDPEGNQQMRYAVLNLPFDQAMVKWFSPFTAAATDPEASMSDKLIRKPGQAIASTALSMVHPVLQSTIAAGTGVVPISGGTIPQENWWDPLLNMLYSGTGAIGEAVKMGQGVANPVTPYTPTALAGDVGGIRLRSVTEGQKKGELLRQEDRLTAILKEKAAPKWMAEHYPGTDPNSEEGKKILHDYFVQIGVLQK